MTDTQLESIKRSARKPPRPALRARRPAQDASAARRHVRLAALLAAIGVGLGAIAAADVAGRAGEHWKYTAFWLGVAVIVAPAAAFLISTRPSRNERLVAVLALGLGFYMVKLMLAPARFDFHDEFAHWRTVYDIVKTHHLFAGNPLIPESGLYPALEVVTSAVSQVTGMSLFASGVIVVAGARVVLVLALFLLLERASGSARIAGLGSLIYAGNPNFLYFDAQFAYESFALPLAALLAYLATCQQPVRRIDRVAFGLGLVIVGLALAVAHHLTSWIFAVALVGVAVVDWIARRRGGRTIPPSMVRFGAAVAVLMPLWWFLQVGTSAVKYVLPHLTGGASQLLSIAEGQTGSRRLFVSAGQVAPLWERLVGFASVGIILVAAALALWLLWRGKLRLRPLGIACALACLAYPATLALRLTQAGAESSNRTSEFLFIALGVLIAGAMCWVADRSSRRLSTTLLISGLVAVLVAGGIIVGWARWARLPGPYVVVGDPNSIEPQGVDAATWAKSHLGPNQRLATDRINGILWGSPLGMEHPVSGLADGVGVQNLILSTAFNQLDRETIRRGRVHYILTDSRLTRGLPLTGVYVESGEPTPTHALSMKAVSKFSDLLGASRLFDSGALKLYAIRGGGG